MSDGKVISRDEAVEYAVEALQELDAQYNQAEVLDQIIRHVLRSGQIQSLQAILDTAREEQLAFDAVLLTFDHLIRTAQPAPQPMVEWLQSYLAGEIPRPLRHRKHRKLFRPERDERDRGIYIIVNELEAKGIPRSRRVRSGSFFGYDVVAEANRRLSKTPNSASGIRASWERHNNALKRDNPPFSQLDALLHLIQA